VMQAGTCFIQGNAKIVLRAGGAVWRRPQSACHALQEGLATSQELLVKPVVSLARPAGTTQELELAFYFQGFLLLAQDVLLADGIRYRVQRAAWHVIVARSLKTRGPPHASDAPLEDTRQGVNIMSLVGDGLFLQFEICHVTVVHKGHGAVTRV